MIQKHAKLLLQTLYCDREAGDPGQGNEMFIKITVDGAVTRYPGGGNVWHMDTGSASSVDIEIDVTYLSVVDIDLYEDDKVGSDECYGRQTITRKSERDETNHGELQWTSGGTNYEFRMTYRVITDPIPTVRVLGIRCEQESAGMEEYVSDSVKDTAGYATDMASSIILAAPVPGSDILTVAFGAASLALKGINEFAHWVAGAIEGPDDVYIEHVPQESTRGQGGSFFPPIEGEASTYEMSEGDEVHFEDKYDEYFRFPLDEGPVTLRFREHDEFKGDISLGTITIVPDDLGEGSDAGISGTTCNGGIAKYDGPAVVEIADSYGQRGEEGAVYQICYSVGTEDWCKPANAPGQGYPPSPPPSNWIEYPELWIPSTATNPILVSNGDGSLGLYQLGSDSTATWYYTPYENGQWGSNKEGFWAYLLALAALGGSERQIIISQIMDYNSVLMSFNGILSDGDGFIAYLWESQPRGLGIASWGPGRVDLFAPDLNKELMHWNSTDGGTTWNYPYSGSYSGEVLGSPGGAMKNFPAAVSWGPDRIDVVARGQDDKLWHIAWDGSQWTAWKGLGGESIQSAPAICSRGVGSLDVFALGSNEKVLYRTYNAGTWATDWTALNSPPSDYAPTAAATGSSRIDVAVRGKNLHIYLATIDFSGSGKSADPSRAAEISEPTEPTPRSPAGAPERKGKTLRYFAADEDGNRKIETVSSEEIQEKRRSRSRGASPQDED